MKKNEWLQSQKIHLDELVEKKQNKEFLEGAYNV